MIRSEKIQDCIGFALLSSLIGPENSRHSLNQSDARRSPAFSRAFGSLLVFTLSSRSIFFFFWLAVVITIVLHLRHSVEKCFILHQVNANLKFNVLAINVFKALFNVFTLTLLPEI